MKRLFYTMLAALLIPAPAGAQKPSATHPDLSGLWLFSIGLPSTALKKEVNGKVEVNRVDASGRRPLRSDVPGALPSAPAPSYKPEFQAKVKHLSDNESKLDPVFYCDRPGIPRIGSPRRIIQLPNEVVFLYEDISGDPYRVIPTDGRPHKKDGNPSYYGDSVGHWEGDTLVVESTNFVEGTWFGEEGYFHSDQMRVVERFWRVGENLAYQVTVHDPKVLTQPWTNFTHIVEPSTRPLEESPVCREDDGHRLL